MQTFVRVSLLLSLALTGAACKKKPAVKQPTVAATDDGGASKQTKQPAAKGDASVAVTGDGADQAPPTGPIYFEFDSTTLTAESRELLSTLAGWMEKKPAAKVRIEGHTDDRGTNEYNLALGDRRAHAIADYLVDLGVDAKRLDTITFGEEKPAANGEDESAWAKNRRGELKTQ